MGSPLASDEVRFEIPPLQRFQRRVFNGEPKTCERDEDTANNKRKSDSMELSSCDMTLKELKERSKERKRLLKLAGLRKQNFSTGSCFDIKQDCTDVQIKEEEFDLQEPLSAWKSKISNKAKRKCIRKQLCSSFESEVSVEVITKQTHIGFEDSFPGVKSKHNTCNSMDEILRPDCSDFQNSACVADGSGPEALAIKDNFQELPDEMLKSVAGGVMENLESNSLVKDSPQLVNEVLSESTKLCESTSSPLREKMKFGEITHGGYPLTINKSLPSLPSELTQEGDVANSINNHNLEDVLQSSCQMDCAAAIQLPDKLSDDNVLNNELSCAGSSCTSDVKSKVDSNGDTLTHFKENVIGKFGNLPISSRNFYPSSTHTDADSVLDGLPITENHPVCTINESMSAVPDGAGEHSSTTFPNASDVFMSTESQNGVELDCLPRRLLSTRKAMSPTSQEKLRRAVDVEGLYHNIGNARSGVEGAKVYVRPGQIHGKPKTKNNMSLELVPKGILKTSPVSLGTPHDVAESSGIHARARKAVEFSHRQMQDIESLAMKLVKEMNLMKDMVEQSVCSSTPPIYTAEEVRIAIQNVTEVEETTKRWLSMMSKDCNRFCKIMRSTGKTNGAERKKITFADEAGGMLCHVKILEDGLESVLASESENVQKNP